MPTCSGTVTGVCRAEHFTTGNCAMGRRALALQTTRTQWRVHLCMPPTVMTVLCRIVAALMLLTDSAARRLSTADKRDTICRHRQPLLRSRSDCSVESTLRTVCSQCRAFLTWFERSALSPCLLCGIRLYLRPSEAFPSSDHVKQQQSNNSAQQASLKALESVTTCGSAASSKTKMTSGLKLTVLPAVSVQRPNKSTCTANLFKLCLPRDPAAPTDLGTNGVPTKLNVLKCCASQFYNGLSGSMTGRFYSKEYAAQSGNDQMTKQTRPRMAI